MLPGIFRQGGFHFGLLVKGNEAHVVVFGHGLHALDRALLCNGHIGRLLAHTQRAVHHQHQRNRRIFAGTAETKIHRHHFFILRIAHGAVHEGLRTAQSYQATAILRHIAVQ